MSAFALPVHTTAQPLHFTSNLSLARRDIGAATSNGLSFFAGGCTTTGTGIATQFICDDASDVIDVVASNGRWLSRLALTEARGWAATCSSGDTVVFAGGGRKGTEPHSRTADVMNARTLKIVGHPDALSSGR